MSVRRLARCVPSTLLAALLVLTSSVHAQIIECGELTEDDCAVLQTGFFSPPPVDSIGVTGELVQSTTLTGVLTEAEPLEFSITADFSGVIAYDGGTVTALALVLDPITIVRGDDMQTITGAVRLVDGTVYFALEGEDGLAWQALSLPGFIQPYFMSRLALVFDPVTWTLGEPVTLADAVTAQQFTFTYDRTPDIGWEDAAQSADGDALVTQIISAAVLVDPAALYLRGLRYTDTLTLDLAAVGFGTPGANVSTTISELNVTITGIDVPVTVTAPANAAPTSLADGVPDNLLFLISDYFNMTDGLPDPLLLLNTFNVGANEGGLGRIAGEGVLPGVLEALGFDPAALPTPASP